MPWRSSGLVAFLIVLWAGPLRSQTPPARVFADAALAQDVCDRLTPPSEEIHEALEPGRYRIVFVATVGSREGQTMTGLLELRPTSGEDTSPRTGERARDWDLARTPLYGWLDGDLGRVGAPICYGESQPRPSSRDAVYPGVLVKLVSGLKGYPIKTPVLYIGTLGNRRNGISGVDGCGIGLVINELRPDAFSGDWLAWGIVNNGSGHFCASVVDSVTQLPPLPPPTPEDVSVTASSSGVVVAWTDDSPDEDGFRVIRRDGRGAAAVIANLPSDAIRYRDRSADRSGEYCYFVTAYNENGTSDYSDNACVTIP